MKGIQQKFPHVETFVGSLHKRLNVFMIKTTLHNKTKN